MHQNETGSCLWSKKGVYAVTSEKIILPYVREGAVPA